VILPLINEVIPAPWKAQRIYDTQGWGHEVLSSEGKRHDAYMIDRAQGALLACTAAMAPECLDYVLRAAEKGGREALELQGRFRALMDACERQATPEERGATKLGESRL